MVAEPDNLFKALADPSRRRILQVLAESELAVSELVEVLRLPQSSVSRHLKTLRGAGMVDVRHEGTVATYFPLVGRDASGESGEDLAAATGESLRARLMDWVGHQPLSASVRDRLKSVLRVRQGDSDAYFAGVAHRWDRIRSDCFGRAFHLEALSALLPGGWKVADIGTGTGYLLPHLAASFAEVVAIDPVEEMLAVARDRVAGAGLDNVTFQIGKAANVPLEDGSLDLVIASLVLHHESDPARALEEFNRILRPGGQVLIVEQRKHELNAFHELMQDRLTGFDPDDLQARLVSAGFERVRWRTLATAEPLNHAAPQAPDLFVMTAGRPERDRVAED